MVQFRAGSYEMDGLFVRSIERRSGSEGNWGESMILINLIKKYENPEECALHAKMDIDSANTKARASQGQRSIDHELVRLGYDRLEENS